ncbi:hypothetical protein ACFWUU_30555 [Kribbella sp. NPDC058693]|uniref:Uncharacterized protein n=1 Tax=Kribbella jiaozuonensis TaxID=2575441 RepID=A0A4U3LYL3_9ACTN|nr:hypothetical protein [Kribbella jiaozuonensis]TKK81395.1 hypothetical protein FDA38_00575 [Kribbella jiaozuonensis]
MGIWLYILSVPVPGLLAASVPVRRMRARALASDDLCWRYLIRVLVLLALTCVVAAIAATHDYPNSPMYPVVAYGPGLALAAVRLGLEAKYVRQVLAGP